MNQGLPPSYRKCCGTRETECHRANCPSRLHFIMMEDGTMQQKHPPAGPEGTMYVLTPGGWKPVREPVLTERTAKRWKLVIAVGAAIMVLGSVLTDNMVRNDVTESTASAIGGSICLFGFVVAAFGSAGAWWHHE